jgi:rhomboid family GlyGly-CTERM serine protease
LILRPAVRSLSPAERTALFGAALLLLLQAMAAWHPALEYRAAALAAEPWRLLTGHFVHINWIHALINASAWWIVARLYAPELAPRRQWGVVIVSALSISAGLALMHPTIAWYRGFSGVLHAIFFAGGVQWLTTSLRSEGQLDMRRLWLPVVLVLGGAIKVLVEQPTGSATPFAEWLGAGTVPQAHLIGASVGVAWGLAVGWRERERPDNHSQPNP